MAKVFITRDIPQAGLELLAGQCDYTVWRGDGPPSHRELCAGVAGCHGILSLLTDRLDGIWGYERRRAPDRRSSIPMGE